MSNFAAGLVRRDAEVGFLNDVIYGCHAEAAQTPGQPPGVLPVKLRHAQAVGRAKSSCTLIRHRTPSDTSRSQNDTIGGQRKAAIGHHLTGWTSSPSWVGTSAVFGALTASHRKRSHFGLE